MKKTKKLALNAQTLRALTYVNLRQVAGGLAGTDGCNDSDYTDTCNCNVCTNSIEKNNNANNSYRGANTLWVYC